MAPPGALVVRCWGLLLLAWSSLSGASVVALVGGTVWTGQGAPIANAVLLLEGGRITAMGPMASVPVPSGAEIVSTEGMTVLPGLVDLAVQTWRVGHGDPARADPLLRPLAARVIAPWVLSQQVSAGITQLLELDSPSASALELRERVEQRRLPGPQLAVAGPVIAWQPAGAAVARAAELLAAGVDVLAIDAPEEWPPAELQAVVEAARTAGKRVWARLRREAGLVPALEAGVDALIGLGLDTAPDWSAESLAAVRARREAGRPPHWLPQLAPLATRVRWEQDAEVLDSPEVFRGLPLLLAQDLRASWTPYSRALSPPEASLRALAAGDRVRLLRDAGAVVVAGSSAGGPALPHALALREELFALVRAAGLSPVEALQAATVAARAALGQSGVLGIGAPADLIAVRGPVLEDIGALRDITVVFVAGRRMK
jgi:imidazolonepropionase-like amidohydrolase